MNVKKRLLVFLITVVLLLFAAAPAFAAENGAAAAVTTSGTVVQAKAPSVYVFAAPQGATIMSPQDQTGLGNFLISDLFLEDGEWLSVTVMRGALTHYVSGNTLPYQVQINLPAVIGMSNIGEAYQATAIIDANALAKAYRGTYQAVLRFSVISHPDGTIVWQGTTTLTVEVPYGTEWEEEEEPIPTSSTASQPVSSKPSVPSTVSTPSKPKPPSQSSAVSQPQPGQPPYMGTMAVKYGLPAAALVVLLLFVLVCVTGVFRNRKNSG